MSIRLRRGDVIRAKLTHFESGSTIVAEVLSIQPNFKRVTVMTDNGKRFIPLNAVIDVEHYTVEDLARKFNS